MIKFDITNRFTGAAQFTAEIDCDDSELTSTKIGLAVKWGIKTRAKLAGANLAGANLAGAYLAGAYLSGANLAGADLARANLARAKLAGADIAGANLAGANLAGAYLDGAYLAGADLAGAKIIRKVAQIRRDDGYEFIAFALDDGRLFVCAGCRSMTVEAFRAHVAKEYPETDKAIETLAILDFIDARHAATSTVLENVA